MNALVKEALRLCTHFHCTERHYENCPDCFGWGGYIVNGQFIPLGSYAATSGEPIENLTTCPFCESTRKGAPER